MMKVKLQTVTDFKVMSLQECMDALGWSYTKTETGFNEISCPCGGELSYSGFFGTEVIVCNKCEKRTVDLFSPIRTSNSTCTILKPSNYEIDGNRHWIADDNNGGIKEKHNA